MREGQGTLKELTALWRQLDARGRWMLVETAYTELQSMQRNPECRSDMPSQAEALKLRQELNEKLYGPNRLGRACSGGKEKGAVLEAEGTA